MGNRETRGKPIEILLVEDNAGDVRLTREALKDAKVLTSLHVARDGEEAMEFLCRKGKYADAPRPDFSISTCPGKTAGRCSPR
jgi:CheY-like chemotaxis protein